MKRNNVFFKKLSVAVLFFGALYLVLSLPVFNVDVVEITGNGKFSDAYIKNVIFQNKTQSLYKFNGINAARELKKNPYIADARFSKTFPDKLSVIITERAASGYVEYINGEFIYIDEGGVVLEVAPDYTERFPVVVGLNFSSFSLGQPILPENSRAFEALIELQYLFNKYELENDIIRVDLSDEDNIRLYIYDIDIEFGGIANADEKIRVLKEVLVNIPDYQNVKGFLDMNTIHKDELARFRRLT